MDISQKFKRIKMIEKYDENSENEIINKYNKSDY
jgi:hypothetical protein